MHAESSRGLIFSAHATKAVSVLVCDEDMLALIEYYLHRAGYGLVVTTNVTDTVVKALAYKPDVVLIDGQQLGSEYFFGEMYSDPFTGPLYS